MRGAELPRPARQGYLVSYGRCGVEWCGVASPLLRWPSLMCTGLAALGRVSACLLLVQYLSAPITLHLPPERAPPHLRRVLQL
jgi:hypothetical protein